MQQRSCRRVVSPTHERAGYIPATIWDIAFNCWLLLPATWGNLVVLALNQR